MNPERHTVSPPPAAPAPTLRALIFDVDGTLAETERDGHRVAFNRAFADAGLAWHWDVATYGELLSVTGGKERMAHWWARHDPAGLAACADVAAQLGDLHRRKNGHYRELLRAGRIGLRPGVARLLAEARQAGLRLAIATTTTEVNVRELVAVTLGEGAWAWFDVVGAGDVVPHKKPAPDIYHWVLQRLGLPAAECLAFEDSLPGVRAACAAGLPTVAVRGEYTGAVPLPGVLADLDGFGEPADPARGRWRGEAFEGCVTVAGLLRDRAAAPAVAA